MRVLDLFESTTNFDIDEKPNGEMISFMATSRDEKPEVACVIVLNDSTITQVELKKEIKNSSKALLELLQYICKRQDDQNVPLAVVADGLKTAMKRKFENFGFTMGEDNIMVRRPGATLPITFI